MYLMIKVFISLCSCLLLVSGDCPDKTFICPSGERFTVGTCWSWSRFSCRLCTDVKTKMKQLCPLYKCYNSIQSWFNRDDGCSAPGILSKPLTVFFGPACAIHDLCYSIRRDPNDATWTRKCDDEFNENLGVMCSLPGLNWVSQPACQLTRFSMYRAVRDHGGAFPNVAANCQRV